VDGSKVTGGAEPPGWRDTLLGGLSRPRLQEFLRDAWLLPRLTLERANRDGIGVTASALAFVTILSLVPLLAAVLFIGTRTFSQYEPKILELLTGFLPYSEAALSTKIQEFLQQAKQVQGVGVLFFVIAALAAFFTVERVINRAWGVPQQRPFRQRLQSFTLLLFWGALLLGGAFSVTVTLREDQGWGAWLDSSGPAGFLTAVILFAGLTMLYWLVPYTSVGIRHALLGGAVATFLLLTLRLGFALYVAAFPGFKVLYGSFAFAFFFMVSIQIAWWIILAGNHLTFVAQHFDALARARRTGGRLPGPWLGLAAVVLLGQRLETGSPITQMQDMAARLRVPPDLLRQALKPLVDAATILEAGSGVEAYVLGGSPRQISLHDIFGHYDPRSTNLAATRLSQALEDLRQRVITARHASLADLTLANLLDTPEAPESEGEKPPEHDTLDLSP